MTAYSVLQDGRLLLAQGNIYRARMLIKAPGLVATEGKVKDALGEQGFADVTFLDKKNLPGDWPADQRDDPSGAFSWTAFLQGRFALTDRAIPIADLPGTVEVLGMWTYLVPARPVPGPGVPNTIPPPPGPGPADLHLDQAQPPVATNLGFSVKLAASACGMLAAYYLVRALTAPGGRRALLA